MDTFLFFTALLKFFMYSQIFQCGAPVVLGDESKCQALLLQHFQVQYVNPH